MKCIIHIQTETSSSKRNIDILYFVNPTGNFKSIEQNKLQQWIRFTLETLYRSKRIL